MQSHPFGEYLPTIGILLLTAGTTQAALLAYDGFGYSAGTLTGSGSASDPGWAGSWNSVSNDANVSAGSLVYPDLQYSGNSATLGADQYCRENRFPDTSGGGPFDLAGLVDGGKIGANGTTLYLSFLQRIASVPGQYPYYTTPLNFQMATEMLIVCYSSGMTIRSHRIITRLAHLQTKVAR